MSKVKICGLSRMEDIDAVNRALPDFVGFVFAPSRRRVDERMAVMLKEKLDARITAVGVFVDEEIDVMVRLCRDGVIDWVQLHGGEDATCIAALRERISNPVIQAVAITGGTPPPDGADYLLFDSERGGSGKTFDWMALCGIDRPYFLAGGLHAGNIHAALSRQPYAVDVSSGVETDGSKDADKIDEFVRIVRATDDG